jgi:hypothetical protein
MTNHHWFKAINPGDSFSRKPPFVFDLLVNIRDTPADPDGESVDVCCLNKKKPTISVYLDGGTCSDMSQHHGTKEYIQHDCSYQSMSNSTVEGAMYPLLFANTFPY